MQKAGQRHWDSGGWVLGHGRIGSGTGEDRIKDMEKGGTGRGFTGEALRWGSWIGVLTQHH